MKVLKLKKIWLKSNVKATKKVVLLSCKGTTGKGTKDYWEIWKKKLGMDVMEAQIKSNLNQRLMNGDVAYATSEVDTKVAVVDDAVQIMSGLLEQPKQHQELTLEVSVVNDVVQIMSGLLEQPEDGYKRGYS
ncbi:hypothetical protein G2W53_002111 [Senna tora]|uniref:Uncharacterized protein n=1 Tax=Senna tora TaxID=362788 RepID=A0A835CKW6_9FABA|nr:hypothetical protein G2W53_002111 [Senna tora]